MGISWGYGDIMRLPAGNLKITIWKITIFTGKIENHHFLPFGNRGNGELMVIY
jgi:hypothetical protein